MPQVALPGVILSVWFRLLVASLPPNCHRTHQNPAFMGRTKTSRSCLSEAERGGFEPPVKPDVRLRTGRLCAPKDSYRLSLVEPRDCSAACLGSGEVPDWDRNGCQWPLPPLATSIPWGSVG